MAKLTGSCREDLRRLASRGFQDAPLAVRWLVVRRERLSHLFMFPGQRSISRPRMLTRFGRCLVQRCSRTQARASESVRRRGPARRVEGDVYRVPPRPSHSGESDMADLSRGWSSAAPARGPAARFGCGSFPRRAEPRLRGARVGSTQDFVFYARSTGEKKIGVRLNETGARRLFKGLGPRFRARSYRTKFSCDVSGAEFGTSDPSIAARATQGGCGGRRSSRWAG